MTPSEGAVGELAGSGSAALNGEPERAPSDDLRTACVICLRPGRIHDVYLDGKLENGVYLCPVCSTALDGAGGILFVEATPDDELAEERA